jgi:tight adherence protein B
VTLPVLCGLLIGAAMLCRPRRLSVLTRRPRWATPIRTSVATWCSSVVVARRLRPGGSGDGLTTAMVLRLVEDLAMQVRAGATPARAWTVVTEMHSASGESRSDSRSEPPGGAAIAWSAAGTAESLARPGESALDSLTRLRLHRGASPALQSLHAAWSLCDEVGAPLAPVLTTVADAIRQDADVEADIDAALAAPRATARLLAVLPLAGLALGELIGAHPVHVLLHTGLGRLCAVAGLLLAVAGQWWTSRLVTRTAVRL